MDFEPLIKWALPRMGFRWEGFRRVVGQVEKCVRERITELGLGSYASYRDYLEEHPDEWDHLDACCRITISRFYRDAPVIDALRPRLRQLADRAAEAGRREVRAWSAGSASGEEPYTLTACWHFDVADDVPGLEFTVTASEADSHMIERAERGVYPDSSLREVPEAWREAMFAPVDGEWRLNDRFREAVTFLEHDVRDGPPAGVETPFDLVCCRYLIFTYCDDQRQRGFLGELASSLRPEGYLVIGEDESLPEGGRGFRSVDETHSIFEHRP